MMRLGRHMPTHSRPVKAAQIAQQMGCNTIQIFASNPTGWRPSADNPEGYAAFAEAARACGLDPVVVHAPYLINLASPDDLIREKSIALLTWTLQRAALLGAKFVVVHTGSHRSSGVEAGIARIDQALRGILPETPPEVMLLLENDVGAGNSLGHSFEQIAAILHGHEGFETRSVSCDVTDVTDVLDKSDTCPPDRVLYKGPYDLLPEYAERLGVCLDTAHLWGAGYDISNAASALQVLEHFDEIIGLSHLKVIHLNDTKMALGSHRDVHARLGEGVIGEEGLRAILCDPRIEHVAVLLETPIKIDEDGKEDWEHDKQHFERAKALLTDG